MKRVLIAFDGSPGADAALRDAVNAGLPDKCEAKVLTIADVWLPPDSPEPSSSERPLISRAEARQRALDVLAAAREISVHGAEQVRTLFPGWTVHPEALADSPAWGILGEARKWHADLVVIGSHGRSPLEKFFLGSVSLKVAVEAVCSVRIFKTPFPNQDRGGRILIAVDGSGDSETAVQQALNRKWPSKTKFQIVTVVDNKLRTAAFINPPYLPAIPADRPHEALAELLKGRAELFRNHGFETTIELLEGDPKSEILQQAKTWEADCIFLGARGLQHGNRLYLGTLASAILTRAHCTVEIIRSTAEA